MEQISTSTSLLLPKQIPISSSPIFHKLKKLGMSIFETGNFFRQFRLIKKSLRADTLLTIKLKDWGTPIMRLVDTNGGPINGITREELLASLKAMFSMLSHSATAILEIYLAIITKKEFYGMRICWGRGIVINFTLVMLIFSILQEGIKRL